jgi:hydroxyacylglutathione hydrolase
VKLTALLGGPLQTVGYLAYDEPGGNALIVDTPFGSARRFLKMVENERLKVLYIVNTHGHWDHTACNTELQKATGAQLCAHTWDATRLANPSLATEDEQALPVPPSRADMPLQDGTVLEVGTIAFRVLHTPGHTPGSICLYEAESAAVFTGDTLFRVGIGRADYPGGNRSQLGESLKKLAALPDKTKIYPGHGLPSSIGEERWLIELAISEITTT